MIVREIRDDNFITREGVSLRAINIFKKVDIRGVKEV
jgi:hypothetical protein